MEPLLSWHGAAQPRLLPENQRPSAVFYTPMATVSDQQIERDLAPLRWSLRVIGEARAVPKEVETVEGPVLLIVDETDRLKPQALEVVRDVCGRSPMGLILVGMPGLEKWLAWYPQLYSQVGFVHRYRALDRVEQQDLLIRQAGQWKSIRGSPSTRSRRKRWLRSCG